MPVSAQDGSGTLTGAVPISGEGMLPEACNTVEGCVSTLVGMGTVPEVPEAGDGCFAGIGAGAVLSAAGLMGGEGAPGNELGGELVACESFALAG